MGPIFLANSSSTSRSRRRSNWIYFLVLATLYVLLLLGMDLLSGEALEPADVAVAVVTGLVISGAILLVSRWKSSRERREPPGSLTRSKFERAMSAGRPPLDASPAQWVPELHRAIRRDRWLAWAGPLLFAGFTALSIYLITENREHPWFWVLATGFFAGTAIWYPIWTHRRRPKLQRLIDQFSTDDYQGSPNR